MFTISHLFLCGLCREVHEEAVWHKQGPDGRGPEGRLACQQSERKQATRWGTFSLSHHCHLNHGKMSSDPSVLLQSLLSPLAKTQGHGGRGRLLTTAWARRTTAETSRQEDIRPQGDTVRTGGGMLFLFSLFFPNRRVRVSHLNHHVNPTTMRTSNHMFHYIWTSVWSLIETIRVN